MNKVVNEFNRPKKFVSYIEVHKLIQRTAEHVKDFNPDYLVAISGGGLIPARILRTYLKVPLICIGIKNQSCNNYQ